MKPTDENIREMARKRYGLTGNVDVDDDAVVSRGDDPGAYVQAWVWVPFEEGEDEEE
jgi:hypothetical protein